mmetsp:Transcript_30262/g.54800  ORF Transcript_30262/g.54800 Transcript_30262/m.54800 type:complete len:575 (-) Transcript_30262:99-1823(-)|eukprot:CAMPEP_0202015166 /NCGR_PEP_ID=MMETSP0905-20130828/31241_1 /ASSEMBLY_ACC=CAM_ASM_000554 /TAXON_ID=420261 /ORGANISM="Thalassiosira antarctica, Strain CCMP982" /LENGTH=574 /DNA_ID=CAMNT_0048575247 /DNA_START=71 /DNA_END=1792 /DNA_ORIENTATION=-
MKDWQTWLLYISVPSLFVFIHSVWLSGEDASRTKSLISDADAMPKDAAPLRSFIDPIWSDWGNEDGQFETLVPPSEIDYSIKNRLPWEQKESSFQTKKKTNASNNKKCDDILLFMPQMFARNGHGSQLNSYLLAAMMATFLGKAMVVLEAPEKYSKYPNGSQFGCPVDGFKNPEEFLNFKGDDHSELEMRRNFPKGLHRLIQHPSWISRDCGIPDCNTFDYNSWDTVRKLQRDYYSTGKPARAITCVEKDRSVQVTVMGGEEVRQFFDRQIKKKMLQRSGMMAKERAYNWAVRLGGTHYQAEVFAKTTKESDIWDYISALIARSGLVTFQPWIVRDVKEFIKSSNLPLDSPHDAIHVRRGDKLATEAREEVVIYWHSQGYERQVDFPLNYIPFTHYLRLWESECLNDWVGVSKKSRTARTIYLATDDMRAVTKEISKLPRGQGGTTIVGGCERVHFVFSPDAHHGSFHLSEGGVKVDCVQRYKRNIHSIADLMILTKSNTFVGEFNSNWGRLVRIFRTQLNDMYVLPDNSFSWKELFGLTQKEETHVVKAGPPVLIHDIRIAFAEDKPIPPPGW